MDAATLHLVSGRLKALADPTRLRILHVLEGGERCVGVLAQEVGAGQANVSKHLAMLRGAGLVRARRCGMNVYYSIDDPVVFRICRLVCDSLDSTRPRLAGRFDAHRRVGGRSSGRAAPRRASRPQGGAR